MVKANFWTDGELLRWPREKRITYQGLWAIAEDSGCVEDDPFEWKLLLWPSPVDADITIEMLQQWRDEFVEAGKLLPYSVDGKSYLFVMNFHKHERPRNPQSPIVPLPPWVTHEIHEHKRATPNGMVDFTRNEYVVDWDLLQENFNRTVTVPSPNNNRTGTLVLSSPVLSSPVVEDSESKNNSLLEAARGIPGWKPSPKDETVIAAGVERLGEDGCRDVVLKLKTRQAATGQYKDLRRTLSNWLNSEKVTSPNNGNTPEPPVTYGETSADIPEYIREGYRKQGYDC